MQDGADGPKASGGHRFGYAEAEDAGVPWGWVNRRMSPAEQENRERHVAQEKAERERKTAEALDRVQLDGLVRLHHRLHDIASALQLRGLKPSEVLRHPTFANERLQHERRAAALAAERARDTSA